jgi:hypothetical protein
MEARQREMTPMEEYERERIEALERTISGLLPLIDAMADGFDAIADGLNKTHLRLLALQSVLEGKELVTEEEVAAKMQAVDEAATLEIEFAAEYEQFRRLRRLLRQADDRPEDEARNEGER